MRSTFFALWLAGFVAAAGACAPTAGPSVPPPEPPRLETPPVASAPSPPPSAPVTAEPTQRTESEKARDDARMPLALAILDAYTSGSPQLTSDGTHFVFASRRDGSRQYYLAETAHPSAPPLQLTRGADRAAAAVLSRDGRSLFFLRDRGVDENYRVYQVGLDGTNETCLTPGPVLRRSLPIEPRRKPGTLVYTQHDVKSPSFDVVVHSLGPGHDPKVVYTDAMPIAVTSVTPDGARALVRRRYSSSRYALFELELATGKTRPLLPLEGDDQGVINDVVYAADGKTIFAAIEGKDGPALVSIDAAKGSVRETYRDRDLPGSPVDQVIASPRGNSLGITIDAGDHTEARILDPQTLSLRAKVQAPLGIVSFTHYSTDGSKIGATISRADVPTDPFVVDARTGAVEPLRNDVRAGLEKLDALDTTIEHLPAFDGLSIPAVVSLPKGAKTDGRRLPVLVAFHGGPAGSAAVYWDTFARFFTSLGYAYVQPNVRGSTGYGRAYEMADNREKRADWLKDVETVNRWAKAQPWADPQRVIAMGGSYGGYTVLMALTRQPDLWRAGVEYVGIANLFTFLKSTDQYIRAVWVDEFGDLEKDQALLQAFNPIREIAKIRAPLFVYAGQNDPRVPRGESDQVVVALRSRGVPVEYQVAANEGHSLDHRENRAEFLVRVARFLDDHAK